MIIFDKDYTAKFREAAQGVGFVVPDTLTIITAWTEDNNYLRVVMTLEPSNPILFQVEHHIGKYETCMFNQALFDTRLAGILLSQARHLQQFLQRREERERNDHLNNHS